MLEQAVFEGYRDCAHMDSDKDLDPLRQREDYRTLLADIERRFPAPAPTPARQWEALQEEIGGGLQSYLSARGRAQTVAERRKAAASRPDFGDMLARALKLADKHSDSPVAMDILAKIIQRTQEGDAITNLISLGTLANLRKEAIAALERDHFQKAELANLFQALAESPSSDCQELLKTAMEKHALPDVRGLAGYALATALIAQAEASVGPSAGRFSRLAEEQLEQVIQKYGTVAYGSTTLGEVSKDKLHALRYLTEGRPAQEIEGEDLEGRPMKLSDSRGKVTVVAFWADWCGYCRQMYARQREMVEELKDRPFALVGVNCDSDRNEARRAVKKDSLNWRSWSDSSRGERISTAWQVQTFPTIYVLDHKGVIRYKFRGLTRKGLDDAVSELLTEAEAAQRKKNEKS
jgi:peroxiredoxin